MELFPYSAYDMGIGLSRVETALAGSCEVSLSRWRTLSNRLQSSIWGLSKTDAHYTANLYCVAEDLIGEGLLPGKKKHAYALRKVVRLLIEEIWIKSEAMVDVPLVLSESIDTSPCRSLLARVLSEEELALRRVLFVAAQKQKEHPEMSPEELRSTYGIRPSLLKL